MKNKTHELYALEQLSGGNTVIHRLHPTVKLITSAVFIVTVVSFDRYAFGRLIPYLFYPMLLMGFSETPYFMLLKRFLIALPFGLFAGVTNIIFNPTPAFVIGSVTVSYGVISFFVILLRTYLCVMGVLLLVSVTPFSQLTKAMYQLKTPGIFITMFEMTYRYIGVLFDEMHSMYIAYSLRSVSIKGIEIRNMGSFVGQLLLRSFDRADRIYNAMKCRGYALRAFPQSNRRLMHKDIAYCVIVSSVCIFFRFVDPNPLFTIIAGGLN